MSSNVNVNVNVNVNGICFVSFLDVFFYLP